MVEKKPNFLPSKRNQPSAASDVDRGMRNERKRSNLKKVHTTFHPTAFVLSAVCPGRERASRDLFVSGLLEASSEQTRDKTSVNSKSVESFRRHKRRWVWGVVGRAQCSGIRGGMVTGLGTQGRVFSAQISPAALYPGICPQPWPAKSNLIC